VIAEPGPGDERLLAAIENVRAALAGMRGDLLADEVRRRVGAEPGRQEDGEEQALHAARAKESIQSHV